MSWFVASLAAYGAINLAELCVKALIRLGR